MPTSACAGSVVAVTRSATPSQVAPPPSAALHTRPAAGSATAPAIERPFRTAATEIAYQGRPYR